jgi:hypothetical protein
MTQAHYELPGTHRILSPQQITRYAIQDFWLGAVVGVAFGIAVGAGLVVYAVFGWRVALAWIVG